MCVVDLVNMIHIVVYVYIVNLVDYVSTHVLMIFDATGHCGMDVRGGVSSVYA